MASASVSKRDLDDLQLATLSRRFLDMRRALPSGDGETTDSEVLANAVREFDVCR